MCESTLGYWGKGAIETISRQLQRELPGLRGFSAANVKFMRQFYETWCNDLKSLTAVSEIGDNKSLTGISEIDTQLLIPSENTQKESFDAVSFLRLIDDQMRKPHENPSIGIVLCKSANKKYVEYVIQDYDKPLGVATYKTSDEMPEKLKQALPDTEELKKLL